MENKEITDTERLDFLKDNHIRIEYRDKHFEYNVYSEERTKNGAYLFDVYSNNIREAIDAAMRGNDGE